MGSDMQAFRQLGFLTNNIGYVVSEYLSHYKFLDRKVTSLIWIARKSHPITNYELLTLRNSYMKPFGRFASAMFMLSLGYIHKNYACLSTSLTRDHIKYRNISSLHTVRFKTLNAMKTIIKQYRKNQKENEYWRNVFIWN